MVYHREQAQFDRAKWRMIVLVPTWILQVGLMLTLMGLFSYRLADTVEHYDDEEENGRIPTVEVVWECTNIGLSLLSLILTIVELAKLGSETLTPWTMLFTHVIKIVCAFAILALDIVVYIQRMDGHYSLVGLVLDCFLITVVLIPAIYSIRTFRRLAVFDDYHYAANAKPYGFSDADDAPLKRNTSLSSRLSIAALSDTLDRHLSSASRRSVNSLPETPIAVVPLDTLGRTGSTGSTYDHRRDTQFDDYLARQSVGGSSIKSDVERAMGTEFGWVGSPVGTTTEELARRDSVVNSGVVASARAVPGGTPSPVTTPGGGPGPDTLGRAPSSGSSTWEARVLTAVPEMVEEDGEEEEDGAKDGAPADRQGLLAGQEVREEGQREADGEGDDEADLGQRKRKWTGP